MKRGKSRKWLAVFLAAAFSVTAFSMPSSDVSEAAEEQLGWVQAADGVSFYGETGALTKGWKSISGKWYYFNTNGLMQTGWIQSGSKWAFAKADGTAVTSAWKKWKGYWYYLDKSAYMTTGWKKISGKWYFFRKDGTMAAGEYIDGYWLKADGAWDGRNAKGAWHKDKKGWWYSEKTGWYPKSRWLWIDGYCYYFDSRGYLVTGKTVKGSKVGKDGAWVKNGKKGVRAGAAKKSGALVKSLESVDTTFTYTITPLLDPFNDFFFIATDNPDPDSFGFVDKSSVYSTSGGSIAPVTTRYEDVKYVNQKTLRVKGGYIAAGSNTDGGELILQQRTITSTTPVTNLTTGEVTYRKNYKTEETGVKVKVKKVVDDVDYLIDTYAKGKSAFFDKLDAVQTGLGSICLYSGVYILGDLYKLDGAPYYGISTSPHIDQRYYIQEPYSRRNSKSMLMSALYPYRLDSVGFPGEMSAVAKRLDPSVTTARNASSHWLTDITYKGTTKSYGGQGSGGGQGINQNQILYTFTFDKSAKDASTKINMTDVKTRICDYGKLTVDTDAGKTIPKLTWAKIRKQVGEGSYVKLVVVTSIFGGSAEGYTYLYDNGATTEGASYMGNVGYMYNCWFDGRYYNKYEYYYPGVTLAETIEQGEQPSLVFKDAVVRLPNDGKQYYCYKSKIENGTSVSKERTVEEYGYDPVKGTWPGYTTFSYNKENNCWVAGSLANSGVYYKDGNKKVYLTEETLLGEATITMDEAESMGIDRNTDQAPQEFLIYDRKTEPGTKGTNP